MDYEWFETNDPAHSTFSTAFYQEFNLYEYDINNQVLPTSIISFRQALSHIVDKDYFINTHLPNQAIKADEPLASLPAWHNPATDDMYNLQPRTTLTPLPDDPADWEAAYDLLVADLGPPVPDPEDPAYFTWLWPSPFPAPGDPVVPDNHLLVWGRAEDPTRTAQANYLDNLLEVVMPATLASLGKPAARIHVDLYVIPRSWWYQKVFAEYRYHLFTGAWSLRNDPSVLGLWLASQITKPAPYGINYLMYSNPNFDLEYDLMMTSSAVPGNPTNPSDMKYHVFLAEEIIMNDAGLIPMWASADYKSSLSNWRGVVNQDGFGLDSWWTFLNAHKVGSEGGDTLRYGFSGDIVTINVISSPWLWDWNIMSKIYDGLTGINPYDVSQHLPSLAKDWEIGTWDNAGFPATYIKYKLREDVLWQDIPLKDRSAYTLDGGHQMDGPFTGYPLTPIDMAFSIVQIRDMYASWNGYWASNIVHTKVNLDIWHSLWPYDTEKPDWWDLDAAYVDPDLQPVTPWQYDFVQHDAALDRDEITVYFNVNMPWQSLNDLGQIPIVPFHIWKNSLLYGDGVHPGAPDIDCWTADIAYGTGPWILLDRQPAISMTLIPFKAGQTYRGITLENSYFGDSLVVEKDETTMYNTEAINGIVAWMVQTVTNIGPVAEQFMWYADFAIAKANYVGGEWVYTPLPAPFDAEIVTDLTGPVTINPGETKTFVVKITPNLPSAPTLVFGQLVAVHDSFHLVHVGGPFDGKTVSHGHFSQHGYGDWDGYWSSIFQYHPGDIAGDATLEKDLYANGILSIADVGPLASHWQHIIANNPHPGGSYNIHANDASGVCRRADLNGDGIINIGDVTIIGFNWQKTWNETGFITW